MTKRHGIDERLGVDWKAMPEGDTIFRTAASLRTWIGDRIVTSAWTREPLAPVRIERLVGQRVVAVEPNGKHLLMRFRPDTPDGPDDEGPSVGGELGTTPRDLVLHTHMRMTGSWHVYETGVPWKRPRRQAVVVLEAGSRVAVGFNIPVLQLDAQQWVGTTPGLRTLGPDILSDPFDTDEVVRRLAAQSPHRPLGELLLDQRIVAGIGNIYRCESLFVVGRSPWAPLSSLDGAGQRALIDAARTLMRANITTPASRDFGGGAGQSWVYRRTGRPCRRCGTAIESKLQGDQARRAYWCPTCQPTTGDF